MNDETQEQELSEDEEDFITLCEKLADQLSELSQAEVPPPGSRTRIDPFGADDVNFTTNQWFIRTLQVQSWMRPDLEVERNAAEGDTKRAALDFFSAVGSAEPSLCFQIENGLVRPTSVGADLIGARLDVAMRLQAAFLENLETQSRKEATQRWEDEWEEEGDANIVAPEPIKATSDTWRILDFSGRAKRDQLNLTPSYQRGDVWPTRDSQKLIESIVRGIPLPSIILLKPKSEGKRTIWEVVDGKQRLTSILRFIGQHPKAISRVRAADTLHAGKQLLELFHKDYRKFRRLWKLHLGEQLTDKREAEYYFPFRLPQTSDALKGELAVLAGKYYTEIKEFDVAVGEGTEQVEQVFEQSSAYEVAIIEFVDATPKQIHEVFHLYNRQGKHLNAEEIRNALFHGVDLVRLVLVASGDNPKPDALAPYIEMTHRPLLSEISRCLSEYRFGSARYRRTKLLSWLYALLFQPSVANDVLTVRSTATQINALFESISQPYSDTSNSAHPLCSHAALNRLVVDTATTLDAHSSVDCWDARFKDDDRGVKWQELQLVASLLAVFLCHVMYDQPGELLEAKRDDLLKYTRDHPRPAKTQNVTQWQFIGEVSLGILDVIGIDLALLELKLNELYGYSCLPTLKAAAARADRKSN